MDCAEPSSAGPTRYDGTLQANRSMAAVAVVRRTTRRRTYRVPTRSVTTTDPQVGLPCQPQQFGTAQSVLWVYGFTPGTSPFQNVLATA